ncbi:hypothetical protein BDA96_03G109600 [Sorghum bicolor]|uniref:Uncharacterized protein n=1 Tax=Sorghum bicolor TaxID=4558 RepID=A0A921RDA1_SORBI|nr:hypothetical protein BDA96_03G109600 [Sorghum bicolor]
MQVQRAEVQARAYACWYGWYDLGRKKMTQAVTPILKLRGCRAKGEPVLPLFVQRGPAGAGPTWFSLAPPPSSFASCRRGLLEEGERERACTGRQRTAAHCRSIRDSLGHVCMHEE